MVAVHGVLRLQPREELANPEGRSYQDNAISSDKQHGDVPLRGLGKNKQTSTNKLCWLPCAAPYVLVLLSVYMYRVLSVFV